MPRAQVAAEAAAPNMFAALLEDTDFVALDVGASHWLPHHWRPYENDFAFVLVEPDAAACAKLKEQAARLPRGGERYQVVEAALSGTGGSRAFYRLNQPTGSSMLKPAVLEESDRALLEFPAEFDKSDYVFPVSEGRVETITAEELLRRTGRSAFHMIKLDTQGTELEIVRGIGDALKHTVLVQMEAGDHGFYLGKPSLGEILAYMNGQGFGLFDLQLARRELPVRGLTEGYSAELFRSRADRDSTFVSRLWEVDAVFVRDPLYAVELRDAHALRRIIVALCAYRMFGEAFQLTGIGEMKGLWDAVAASRYRRDILACHRLLKHRLDKGERLYWERA